MSDAITAIREAVATCATKPEAANRLSLPTVRIASIIRSHHDPELCRAWRDLPSEAATDAVATGVPRPSRSQEAADALIRRVCEVAPIDPASTQRDNVAALILTGFRLVGDPRLPKGWVRAAIGAFTDARHPQPPTPAILRWYCMKLAQDPTFCSGSAAADWASALWEEVAADKARERAKAVVSIAQPLQELVAEACGDCPIDPERSEREGAVLLMLALYNITGSLDWGSGWGTAITLALERGGALTPTRGQLVLYRQQLAECPWSFSSVVGADPILLSDLAGALTHS